MSTVCLIPCTSYEEQEVYTALAQGIDLLGGLSQFVSPADRILLKPNLLSKAPVEKAITTHPMVLKGVARLLQEAGCSHISYGDSPATHAPDKAAEVCGLTQVAQELGLTQADFSHSQEAYLDNPLLCDKFQLCNGVLEADSILNLCKMKTHALERITGAVKNLYGCVHGLNKGKMHTQFPNATSFADMLTDLNRLVGTKLHIMDGIVAMEGNGPASGSPVPMGVLLLSADPVALDSVFCALVHLNPALVPTNVSGEKNALGTYHWENITLRTPEGACTVEEGVARYGSASFDVCRGLEGTVNSTMSKIVSVLQRRPAIQKEKCIKCGACVEACPLPNKALVQTRKQAIPKYRYKACIRCYCCQEICPAHAITVKEPLLAKVFQSR